MLNIHPDVQKQMDEDWKKAGLGPEDTKDVVWMPEADYPNLWKFVSRNKINYNEFIKYLAAFSVATIENNKS